MSFELFQRKTSNFKKKRQKVMFFKIAHHENLLFFCKKGIFVSTNLLLGSVPIFLQNLSWLFQENLELKKKIKK